MTLQLHNKKILIVEDVVSSILYYKSAFKHSGAEILIATNGRQAVDIIVKNSHIDIILMDIVMPEMNGLDATKKIKEISPDTSVIIQTAYVQKHTAYQCFEAGCDAFLEKPVSLTKLLNLVDELINKK